MTKKTAKPKMPKARKPAGGKAARGVKLTGKASGRKKSSAKKGAKKMPFAATKAPGARKAQPAQKRAMRGGMPGMKKGRKKKGS